MKISFNVLMKSHFRLLLRAPDVESIATFTNKFRNDIRETFGGKFIFKV